LRLFIIIQERRLEDVANGKLEMIFAEFVKNGYHEREIGTPCSEQSAKYHGVRYFSISLHHYSPFSLSKMRFYNGISFFTLKAMSAKHRSKFAALSPAR
jgi:hypothetical protein